MQGPSYGTLGIQRSEEDPPAMDRYEEMKVVKITFALKFIIQ